jgi:hypothetical protein
MTLLWCIPATTIWSLGIETYYNWLADWIHIRRRDESGLNSSADVVWCSKLTSCRHHYGLVVYGYNLNLICVHSHYACVPAQRTHALAVPGRRYHGIMTNISKTLHLSDGNRLFQFQLGTFSHTFNHLSLLTGYHYLTQEMNSSQ